MEKDPLPLQEKAWKAKYFNKDDEYENRQEFFLLPVMVPVQHIKRRFWFFQSSKPSAKDMEPFQESLDGGGDGLPLQLTLNRCKWPEDEEADKSHHIF